MRFGPYERRLDGLAEYGASLAVDAQRVRPNRDHTIGHAEQIDALGVGDTEISGQTLQFIVAQIQLILQKAVHVPRIDCQIP